MGMSKLFPSSTSICLQQSFKSISWILVLSLPKFQSAINASDCSDDYHYEIIRWNQQHANEECFIKVLDIKYFPPKDQQTND